MWTEQVLDLNRLRARVSWPRRAVSPCGSSSSSEGGHWGGSCQSLELGLSTWRGIVNHRVSEVSHASFLSHLAGEGGVACLWNTLMRLCRLDPLGEVSRCQILPRVGPLALPQQGPQWTTAWISRMAGDGVVTPTRTDGIPWTGRPCYSKAQTIYVLPSHIVGPPPQG